MGLNGSARRLESPLPVGYSVTFGCRWSFKGAAWSVDSTVGIGPGTSRMRTGDFKDDCDTSG